MEFEKAKPSGRSLATTDILQAPGPGTRAHRLPVLRNILTNDCADQENLWKKLLFEIRSLCFIHNKNIYKIRIFNHLFTKDILILREKVTKN